MCSLQTLDLFFPIGDDGELIETLELTPQLTKLSLRQQGSACLKDKIMSRLTCRPSDSSQSSFLVPKLKSLSFEYYHTLNEMTFAKMVRSRMGLGTQWGIVDRLNNVDINAHSYPKNALLIHPEARATLRQCREEGLSITWHVRVDAHDNREDILQIVRTRRCVKDRR